MVDGILGILGAAALVAGAMFTLVGFASGDFITVYQGAALLASGLGMLATSEVIKTLKQIRDRLPTPDQTPR